MQVRRAFPIPFWRVGVAALSSPNLGDARVPPRVSCWWRRGEGWVMPGEAGVTPQGDARTNSDSQPRRQIGVLPFFNSPIRIFRPVGFVLLPTIGLPSHASQCIIT